MKEFNKFMAYICTMTIMLIVGLPAYVVGESSLMAITFFVALIAIYIYIEHIMKKEEYEEYDEYED